ncbi:PTS sugar transporter subunit IIA [Staphylococcus sp. ACRSN]|uniref:PTS sugar transporter subunit IIA n=1 Tax=Staphylococcus sp. ACRSN TaxID=2918214 RepID=UPI001EF237DD|nr:PTS sugar transporter subunit IIA [Staphylococcus sp. ACRSN]MCG7338929.1 PTS sugar transporter subunit IIA [Staphylococcus sp. ACRSN]
MHDIKIDAANIIIDLEANQSEEALKKLSNLMYNNGDVKSSYTDAVIERERTFATGLPTAPYAVAIPHTDIQHVNDKSIGIAVLKNTVPFVIMGELEETTDVKLIFMLAMDKEAAQLSLLQKLMGIFQNEQTLTTLVNAKHKQEIVTLIKSELNEEA